MEEIELKQLAIDISENKVFGTFHMSKNDMKYIQVVFIPLIAMTKDQRQKLVDNEVVHFYEYYNKAGPRSVNGMPCFFSMYNITKNDWIKTVKYIKQYKVKVQSFLSRTKKENKEPSLFE